jgi:hypothetical protein
MVTKAGRILRNVLKISPASMATKNNPVLNKIVTTSPASIVIAQSSGPKPPIASPTPTKFSMPGGIGGGNISYSTTTPKGASSEVVKELSKVLSGANLRTSVSRKPIDMVAKRLGVTRAAVVKRVGEMRNTQAGYNASRVANFVSGGAVDRKKLKQAQERQNKAVEDYNKKYGGFALEEGMYNRAFYEGQVLSKTQKQIDKVTTKKAKSGAVKFGDVFWGRSEVKNSSMATKNLRQSLARTQAKIDRRSSKGKGTKLLSKRLGEIQKSLSSGKTKLYMGDVPLTPSNVAFSVAKAVKVKFIGTQANKNGKIVTNLIFTQGKKIVGKAKGVTLVKGKNSLTFVKGSAGRYGVKFPSGKAILGRKKSFVGYEFTGSRMTPAMKKILGTKLKVVNDNIKIMQSKGVGRISVVKGSKFYQKGIQLPSGKLVNKRLSGINGDSFASVSKAITRKNLTKIVGKTITGKFNKAEFEGFIRGTKSIRNSKVIGSGGGLKTITKTQYKQALSKVASIVAVSSRKVSKVRGLSNAARTSQTVKLINKALSSKTIPSKNPSITQIVKQINTAKVTNQGIKLEPEVIVKPIVKPIVVPKPKPKPRVRVDTAQKIIITSASGTKVKTQQKAVSKSKITQQQAARLRVKQAQKSVIRTVTPRVIRPRYASSKVLRPYKMIILPMPRIKGKLVKSRFKKTQLYIPYAKQGKRYVRLSKLPLKKNDALSRASYVADNTVSSTIKLKPVGRSKRIGKLKSYEKNYFTNKNKKFRGFTVRKGKKYAIINKAIERKKFRIDTKGEKKGLSVARFLKRKRIR